MKYHQCLILCWLILCQHHSKSLASASPAAAPHRHSINRHRWLHMIYVLLLQVNSFLSVRYGLSLLTCYAVSSRKKDWILISFETGLCVCVCVCMCVHACVYVHTRTCTHARMCFPLLKTCGNYTCMVKMFRDHIWFYLILLFSLPGATLSSTFWNRSWLSSMVIKFQMSCSLLHWIPILRKDMKSLFLTLCASLFWFIVFGFVRLRPEISKQI